MIGLTVNPGGRGKTNWETGLAPPHHHHLFVIVFRDFLADCHLESVECSLDKSIKKALIFG